MAQKYSYRFSVYPDETWGFGRFVFTVFQTMGTRVELTFTEQEFERFRSGLARHGLTLREVERVPFAEPEAVE